MQKYGIRTGQVQGAIDNFTVVNTINDGMDKNENYRQNLSTDIDVWRETEKLSQHFLLKWHYVMAKVTKTTCINLENKDRSLGTLFGMSVWIERQKQHDKESQWKLIQYLVRLQLLFITKENLFTRKLVTRFDPSAWTNH